MSFPLLWLFLRMPVETRSSSSGVGRYADATLDHEEEENKENEAEPKEENAEEGIDKEGSEEMPDEENPGTDASEPDELLLEVQSIDLTKSKSEENRTKHHTQLYHGDEFIIQRTDVPDVDYLLATFRHQHRSFTLNLKQGPARKCQEKPMST
ncbi:hypothetical protein LDENG_00101300 [Lucifuga dentata]|nr:hypothetical protein LDENG_00101300 [Lucifuga dentata]